jgi:WD40 repeat protein
MTTQLKAIAFDSDIAKLTENFTGRQWVFDVIDRWLKESEERFFILTGEPGVGKSAIAARLTQIRDDIAAYHFCRANDVETVRPGRILRSLAAQMGENLPDYGQALANTIKPIHLRVEVNITIGSMTGSQVTGVYIENLKESDPENELDILIRAPLEELQKMYTERQQAQPTLAIILIDSLDEAVTTTGTTLVKLLTQLSKSTSLPSWVRFVLTSRPERRVLRGFEPLKPYHLREKSDESLADVRRYVENRVDQPALQDQLRVNQQPQTLINEITRLSQGNFLYTTLLLNDIEAGRQALDSLAALPKSIDDIYHGFLSRFSEEDWSDRYKPIFGVLTVAQEPISEKQISNFTKIDSEDVRDSIRIARQFFDVELDEQNKETYSIFHQSLRDYLLDEDRNSDFWCNEQKQHQRITNFYMVISKTWKQIQELDNYAFRYLLSHLAKNDQKDEIRKLLIQFEWLQGRLFTTDVSFLIQDLNLISSQEDISLSSLQGFVQISSDILAKDKLQFTSQIVGRLSSQISPEIQLLVEKAKQWKTSPWLCPMTPSLISPKEGLIKTLGEYRGWIGDMALTADGERLICIVQGSLRVLKLDDLKEIFAFDDFDEHIGFKSALTLASDEQKVLCASGSNLKVWTLSNNPETYALEGHTAAILSIAITSDGQHAITASEDKTLKVWNLNERTEVRTLTGHTDQVLAVAVSPDRQLVLSGSRDKTLKVWSLVTGELIHTLIGHTDDITAVTVTPDCKQAISASLDRSLRVWDLTTGKGKTLSNCDPIIDRLVVSSDEKIISTKFFQSPQVWNLVTGEEVKSLNDLFRQPTIWSLNLDKRQAVSASLNQTPINDLFTNRRILVDSTIVRVWNLDCKAEPVSLAKHTGVVSYITVTPDGKQAVSVAKDSTIKIWNLSDSELIETFEIPMLEVFAISVKQDERKIISISASGDNTLKVWNLNDGSELFTLRGHTDKILAVAMTSDGNKVISASQDNTLKLWNLNDGSELFTLRGHTGKVLAVAVTLDGKKAISTSQDCSIRVWDLNTGTQMSIGWSESGPIKTLAVNFDGAEIVTVSQASDIHIYSLRDNLLGGWRVVQDNFSTKIVALPLIEPSLIASISTHTNNLRIRNLKTGKIIASYTGDSPLSTFAITPDGRMITVGDQSGTVHFLQLIEIYEPITKNTNKTYEEFNKYLQLLPSNTKLEQQKKWTLQHLGKRGLSISSLKLKLQKLEIYKGILDEEFTQELVEAIYNFQRHHNITPADGICGPMTLEKLYEFSAD